MKTESKWLNSRHSQFRFNFHAGFRRNAFSAIQAGNPKKDAYLIVIVEDKTAVFGVDLESLL